MVLKLPFGRIVRRADNTLDIASFQTRFSFLTIFWFLVSGLWFLIRSYLCNLRDLRMNRWQVSGLCFVVSGLF
jgi:uncharacterized membrane protein YccF (DUF307 family)